jgi:hypothetical protein
MGLAGDVHAVLHGASHSVTSGHGLPAPRNWIIAGLGLIVVLLVELAQTQGSVRQRLRSMPAWVRWPAYIALTYSTVAFGSTDHIQFVYFQF